MTKIQVINEEESLEAEEREAKNSAEQSEPEDKKTEASFKPREIFIDEKDKTLEKIYQDEDLQLIQKPPRMSQKALMIGIFIAFLVGLVAGIILAVLFFRFFS
jgi:hypothetical protein